MRLNQIEIENFKGINDSRQMVDLRPITLLFGPNSAGKSTIFQALHYLREILERGNLDPDVTVTGGLTDLGGFATLVHNHDLDRTIKLKLTLDVSSEQRAGWLPLNDGKSVEEPKFSELSIRYLVCGNDEDKDHSTIVQSVGLEVDIRWSDLEQAPYVSRISIEMNGELIADIVSPPQKERAQLTNFNFAHTLLQHAILPNVPSENETKDPISCSPLRDEIRALTRESESDLSAQDILGVHLRIAVRNTLGALPVALDGELILDIYEPALKEFEFEQTTPRVNGLRALLSELILGPVRIVRDYLSQMTYIGPIREVPPRNYRPQKTPDNARWAQGLAAWDLLYNDRGGDLMREVNKWLSSETRLCTTYRLERVQFKEVQVSSATHQMLERGLSEDGISEFQELCPSLSVRTEIALRDLQKSILVAPIDVGVGISQMIPVVVAALRKQNGILGIEQPELHVHPAIQVGMGDLFIRAAVTDPNNLSMGKTLIIETHSEHIMLRLLRRIRETRNDELPADVGSLTPRELSIIYVESDENGVRFQPLRIDADGEFLDRWPHGFFEERADELF